MSKLDERRAEREAFEREQMRAAQARPNVSPRAKNPDADAWDSTCAGWRGGFHERYPKSAGTLRERTADGKWRCKWCGRALTPPVAVPA